MKNWILKTYLYPLKMGIGWFSGASGAGKTTLVDILLGLLQPQEGDILFNNRSLNETFALACTGSLLPQNIFL